MASPSSSLSHSSPQQQPVALSTISPLDKLVTHLLASKKSLSTIEDVQRANDLCTSTRSAVEQTAVTTARTSFLRSGIMSQLGVLQRVHQNTSTTAKQINSEFESVVRDLDEADARLRATLDALRSTFVETKLRPEGEEKRSLLDFVDEGGVDGVLGAVRGVLDGAGEGMNEFADSNKGFEEELKQVKTLISGGRHSIEHEDDGKGMEVRRGMYLSQILHEMEDHARNMAANLESLVSHFDLCAKAIRHTEGGGDAASRIACELPEGVDIGQDNDKIPEPMSDEQWTDMMRVLEDDAGQVDDVVTDIREHVGEMEALYEHVETHTDRLAKEHASTAAAFRLLEDIGRKLPGYITHSQVFLIRWDEDKEKIEERLEELDGIREFYDDFLRAYDNLLIEVGRRKALEMKMDKVVQEARSRLAKLYDDDVEEREAFRKEEGHFLPQDIWPGLASLPLRFQILPIDESAARVPDISKSVIHRAIRRTNGER
ncbi:hypothetical protein N7G274_001340 [Stereocaulon virgatum]|uniref:Autophagy-related protein 17 n=1 Tax=Stereocaulon virgatum TaxID=373712 RepID=A0ABR4AP52_9LECA